MIFINEMVDMKIYNKPFFAPINTKDKKKNSLTYLLSPNLESSKKMMTMPNMINRLYYQSYYLEKNVNYFINSSMLENADINEEYLREISSNYLDYTEYINEGFAAQATMYFRIKNKQNLFKILQKHSYEGLLNLVKKTKNLNDLLYLRRDYYQGMNTFKKIQERMEKCEKLGPCKETKNYYKGINDKYLSKGITSKDVELTMKWYKEVYYPTLKEQISLIKEEYLREDNSNYLKSKEMFSIASDIYNSLSDKEKNYVGDLRVTDKNRQYYYFDNIKLDGKPIAYISAFNKDRELSRSNLNIIIATDPEYRSKGYAKQLIKKFINYSKSQKDIDLLFWNTYNDNVASQKLAESMGFILVYKNNKITRYCYPVNKNAFFKLNDCTNEVLLYKYISENIKPDIYYNSNLKARNSKKILESKKANNLELAKLYQDTINSIGFRTLVFVLIKYTNTGDISEIYPITVLRYSKYNYGVLDKNLENIYNIYNVKNLITIEKNLNTHQIEEYISNLLVQNSKYIFNLSDGDRVECKVISKIKNNDRYIDLIYNNSIKEETIDTLELNFSTCFNAYKLVENKPENDDIEWTKEDFYPTIEDAIRSLEDRHGDKKYFVYTYTNKGSIYIGSIKITFLDTERFDHSWSDIVDTLDKDDFSEECPLNESGENKINVSYSGYKSDVEEFRDIYGRDLENGITQDEGKYHFIIKDDIESCRIWISEDGTLNIEVPNKKIYTKYYGDNYKVYIHYNILCAELIQLNPIIANTCIPYVVASYLSKLYLNDIYDNDSFDRSVWNFEDLLDRIEKDKGLGEIFNIVKKADIAKLYNYSIEYKINIGSIDDLKHSSDVLEVSKDRQFDLKYYTRHIMYNCRKGKHKAHKLELDIKKNLDGNKPNNTVSTAPTVADIDNDNVSATPDSGSGPSTDTGDSNDTANTTESFTKYILNSIDESMYIKSDNMIMFTEDTNQDAYLRKLLFADRLRQNKDVLLKYSKIKEELDFIKYTFVTVDRYADRNLFVDLSYYNEIFFRNNQFKLDKGINLYAELLRRLLNTPVFNSYTLKTVFIPINDWDIDKSTRMWIYKENINPISVIYRLMETMPAKLKEIFGDMDILFISNNRYFKLNFSHTYDYNSLKTKFKLFINNLRIGNDVSDEDKDDTPNNKESKQAIVTNIVDKVETSTGVKLKQYNLTGSETDTSKSEKITTNKDTDEIMVTKKKDELLKAIDKAADKANNTDDALDKLEDEKIKKLIVDLASQEEDSVKINNARASRMLQLQNDMLDIKLNNITVKELLSNDKSNEELPKSSIPVSVNKEVWTDMKFTNFDAEYNINEDIVKMLNKLSTVSRPLVIRNINIVDNSTSEDFIDLYTIDFEDYRGKRFTVKFDVPKFKSNSDYLILRGNKKTIQNQFFNMPIIKTEEDTCQIISNYNKIFVRRFGTVAGRSIPDAGKIIKAINKYKGSKTKIQFGNNITVCKKYELPIDYIDIAQVVNKIENSNYIIYFNQDEIRELYKDKINDTIGLPVGYDKSSKEIIYYNGSWYNDPDNSNVNAVGYPFSSFIVPLLLNDTEFKELYDAAAKSVKYTYSKCSIMSTEIPLILVCAYSEGLSQVLKKAKISYEIKEKLEKADRQSMFNYIRFNDAYIVYRVDYNSSLLLNGLKDCDTESYSISNIDSKSMYVDFLDNFGGRIKADGLENFYDCMIDPITEEVLEHYNLPTDYVEVLLHANLLLSDNKYIKHTDTSSRRLRKQELIAVKVYKSLFNDAYVSYANQLRHNKTAAQFTVKQSCVIDKFMEDSTSSDLSVINCLNDIETKNAVTFKGESGLNTDRAYSLDKRTYDDSMLNLIAMSTGFSGNVGITRQATVDMNIDGKRGYIKSINNNTDKLSSSKTLSMTEALNPFGTTRDDPFRTAMTFIQTAKHAVRTTESDPLLVTNAADEAIPYLSSDIFAFKAKQDGKVLELTDEYILLEYKDGTKDYVNLSKTIEKNSDGGFYVPMKLDKIDKLKEGSKFKAKDILAYDKLSFSNSLGENDNLAFNVGTLTKVAVINTDEGFEDSTIITSSMSERMATDIIVCKDILLDKETIVSGLVPIDQSVEEGDTLLIISNSSDDDTTNTLMKNLIADEDEISELGRRKIKSPVTGKIAGIKIYRTVEVEELSKSLQQLVKKYEDPIKKTKKKLDSNKILSSDLPATYTLPATGKLKNAVDSIRIEIYIEVHDILSVGDKIVMDRANKGIIKDIIPSELAPYTDFRPNEEVSVFANVSSFNKRMVISPLVIGSINKLLIELDRSIKDILEIPYDDSKI